MINTKDVLVQNLLESKLLGQFHEIREIVHTYGAHIKHEEKEQEEEQGEPFLPSLPRPSQHNKVEFKSCHLVGIWVDKEPHGIEHLDSCYLGYPVSYKMILEFLQLNRHFLSSEKEGHIRFNEDFPNDSSPDDYPPLPLEEFLASIQDDVSFYEIDDRYSDSELMFGILVNKTQKLIKVVFRESETLTDWLNNFKLIQCKTELSFANKKLKIHSGFINYLLKKEGTKEAKIAKIEQIIGVLKEIRSAHDAAYSEFDIVTIGYSLGGALAQMFSFVLVGADAIEDLPLPIIVITYAAPGVGNKFYLKKHSKFEMKNYLRHIRVTVNGDIVPCVNFSNTPMPGVNIHLYKDRIAKVKYSDGYNYNVRIATTAVKLFVDTTGTKVCHSSNTYADLINTEVNADIKTMSVNDLYSTSGANARLRRRSLVSSMYRATNGKDQGCFCRSRQSTRLLF